MGPSHIANAEAITSRVREVEGFPSFLRVEDEVFLLESGHTSALRALIAVGILNPNVSKRSRLLLLLRALFKRNHKMVRILLEDGADLDARAVKGDIRLAMWYAARAGHTVGVMFLLKYGAEPHRPTPGPSPLLAALNNGEDECVALLARATHG